MTIGDYVKQYRVVNALSQRQFAAKAGLSSGYISMLEANRSPRTGEPLGLSITTFERLCRAMEVDPSQLIAQVNTAPETGLTAKEWKLLGWFRAVEEPYQDAVLDMLQARVKSRR